jgi:hypothetical protein
MYVIYAGHISQLKNVCDILHVLVDLYDQNISHTCFS